MKEIVSYQLAGRRTYHVIAIVIGLLLVLLTFGIAIENLPDYGPKYGWLCATVVCCYMSSAGAICLPLGLLVGMMRGERFLFRFLEVSSTLYLLAGVIALVGEGFKGDFYPVLVLIGAIVGGLRISLDPVLLACVRKHLSPAALNKPNPEQERRLKFAAYATLWIGIGNLIIVVLGLTKVLSVDFSWMALVAGCLFIVLWSQVKRLNETALLLAVILTVLIIIWNAVSVVRIISKGGVPLNLGSIAITVGLLIWLIQGLRTMKHLKSRSPTCHT